MAVEVLVRPAFDRVAIDRTGDFIVDVATRVPPFWSGIVPLQNGGSLTPRRADWSGPRLTIAFERL
jgi:hypothetical protein